VTPRPLSDPLGTLSDVVGESFTEREARLVARASTQRGLITSAQLEELGFSRTFVDARVKTGAWRKMQRGVFKISPGEKTIAEREMAAVLAFDGVLSHGSAARQLGIDVWRNWKVQLTIDHDRRVRGATLGVDIRRARDLHPADIITDGSLRYTNLARTVLDVAEDLAPRWLRATIDKCAQRDKENLNRIWLMLLSQSHGRHGAPELYEVLTQYHSCIDVPDSVLESVALELVPLVGSTPAIHYIVHLDDGSQRSRDFVWPELKLNFELDGYDFHASQEAFEADREVDRKLRLMGWRVERFTWKQVNYDRNKFLGECSAIFAQRRYDLALLPTG
jgi:hypothetical protein